MSNKKVDTYSQCILKKADVGADIKVTTTSWIPSEFALVGRRVALKDDVNGKPTWTDWIVESIGNTMDAEYVEDHRDDYRDHRKATDI